MRSVLDEERIAVRSEADMVAGRNRGRALARDAGFRTTDQTLIATAISEVTRNILRYAGEGELFVRVVVDAGRRGLVVVARDDGPGIPDIDAAMRDGYSTGRSLGLGLPGAKRLMDALHIDTVPGEGTTVTMEKWTR